MAASVIVVERDAWNPGREWREALDHLAGRFARVAPLDVDAVLGEENFAAQIAALTAWSQTADVDLDRELGRWFDEHLAMHLRPDPSKTRAVRALAAEQPVHATSALPPRAAESILRHTGLWRSVSELHSSAVQA